MGLFCLKPSGIKKLFEIEIDNPRSTRVDIIISTSKQTYCGCLNPQEKSQGMNKVYLAGRNENDQVKISQDSFNQKLKIGESNVFLFERGE